jgi:hypothetical protein
LAILNQLLEQLNDTLEIGDRSFIDQLASLLLRCIEASLLEQCHRAP